MAKPCAPSRVGVAANSTSAYLTHARIRSVSGWPWRGGGIGWPTVALARILVKQNPCQAHDWQRLSPVSRLVRGGTGGRRVGARARQPDRRAHRLQRRSGAAGGDGGAYQRRSRSRGGGRARADLDARWDAGAHRLARGTPRRVDRVPCRGDARAGGGGRGAGGGGRAGGGGEGGAHRRGPRFLGRVDGRGGAGTEPAR